MANDVLEHVEDGASLIAELAGLLCSHGRLVIGTPDAAALDLSSASAHKHYLHAPFHFHLYTLPVIVGLAAKAGLRQLRTANRSVGEAPFIFGMNYAYGEQLIEYSGGAVDALIGPSCFRNRFGRWQLLNGIFGYFYSGGKSLLILFEKV